MKCCRQNYLFIQDKTLFIFFFIFLFSINYFIVGNIKYGVK